MHKSGFINFAISTLEQTWYKKWIFWFFFTIIYIKNSTYLAGGSIFFKSPTTPNSSPFFSAQARIFISWFSITVAVRIFRWTRWTLQNKIKLKKKTIHGIWKWRGCGHGTFLKKSIEVICVYDKKNKTH